MNLPQQSVSEKDVTEAIKGILKQLDIFHWKQWQGPLSQPKGVSDILGILPGGRMFAVEVKKPGWSPPSPRTKAYRHYFNQQRFINAVNRSGGIGLFAQSVEEVIHGLGLRDRLLF